MTGTGVSPFASTRRAAGARLERVRIALSGVAAAVLGAAPHVLHHAGPLAGAALLGGAAGAALFGVLGFLASIPFMLRLRRRSGSWRLPVAALAVMASAFALSTLVVGPALSTGGKPADDRLPAPGAHESHHED